MFHLTFRERKILLAIGILIAAGSLIKHLGVVKFSQPVLKISYDSGPVDINRASLKELESLSGIGKVIAERIIKYRLEYGSFKNLKDLKKVKGIGSKKADNINKYVVFK